jgi:hypothetical protein
MDEHRHERRHHFRGKARPDRVMEVRFRVVGHTGWIVAVTRDIGVGGAFLTSQLVQPIGTALTLELTPPSTDQVFTLPAIVRWAVSSATGGMGVEFVDIAGDVRRELADYFATLDH